MLKFKKAEKKLQLFIFLLSSPLFMGSFYMEAFDRLFLYEKLETDSSSSIQQRINTEKSIYFQDGMKKTSIFLNARNSYLEILKEQDGFSLTEKLSDLSLKMALLDDQKKDTHILLAPYGEFNYKNRSFVFHQVDFSTTTQSINFQEEKKIICAYAEKMDLFFNEKPFKMKAHDIIGHVKDEF